MTDIWYAIARTCLHSGAKGFYRSSCCTQSAENIALYDDEYLAGVMARCLDAATLGRAKWEMVEHYVPGPEHKPEAIHRAATRAGLRRLHEAGERALRMGED
jgi:hypothetical protein